MNLEVVRRYRAQVEDHVRQELAELDQRWEAAMNVQERGHRAADDRAVRYVAEMRAGLDALETGAHYRDWEALCHEAERADVAVAKAAQDRARKQAELAAAIRERKQIELLLSRRERERRLQDRRRAQREMDDLANSRWAMARREDRDREEGP